MLFELSLVAVAVGVPAGMVVWVRWLRHRAHASRAARVLHFLVITVVLVNLVQTSFPLALVFQALTTRPPEEKAMLLAMGISGAMNCYALGIVALGILSVPMGMLTFWQMRRASRAA